MSHVQMSAIATAGVKVSLSMLASSAHRCPAHDAMAVRQGRSPARSARRKAEALESFAQGPFMTVLDLVEGKGVDVDHAFHELDQQIARGRTQPIHEGVRAWTAHSVSTYLRAFGQGDGEATVPVLHKWVYRRHLSRPDERGATDYAITAWGRCYTSLDGRTRELRLIKNRLGTGKRTDAEVSVAALVVAAGEPGPPPERVRILQIALLDGAVETLFDDSVESAIRLYRTHGKAALGELVDNVEYRPGAVCADCAFAPRCPALPRAPGLLGLTDRSRPRRTWSATNARQYRDCPAREYLRRQWLPVDASIEYGPAAERGRAVHAYLERRHGALPTVPCTKEVPPSWVDESRRLSEEDLALGTMLIRHHAEVCPLQHVRDSSDLRIEPDLVFDDTGADLVVLVKPDLLYREHGAWVWREMKTAGSDRRGNLAPLVQYPQLALAVALIGAGRLGGGHGRVELETLRPGGSDLVIIDPFTAEVRAAASRALTDHVRAWHADDRFLPSPGPQCTRCEVARWCPSRLSVPAKAGSTTPGRAR
jgi:hypothetical protein